MTRVTQVDGLLSGLRFFIVLDTKRFPQPAVNDYQISLMHGLLGGQCL